MEDLTKNKIVRGYKVFNSDFTCRGFQYELGKEYTHEGDIVPCKSGFHFCKIAVDCFSYYKFDSNNIVCEVEARGLTIDNNGDKTVTNVLFIKRQLTWIEVLSIVNTGKNNTGHRNSGHSNSGRSNSGHSNSGHSNSGDSNSGDSNSGDSNSGHSNSGDSNSGHRNSGRSNSGHSNSGRSNSGDSNSGHRNSGHRNSGRSNSGHSNSGRSNSGDSNSGDRNSGDYNSTSFSSGIFNNKESRISIFNKESNWTLRDWQSSEAYSILSNLVLNEWIWFDDMTDEEKIKYPKAYVCNGYLKAFKYKEACKNLWNTLSDSDKKIVQALPNFDAGVFLDITGIAI